MPVFRVFPALALVAALAGSLPAAAQTPPPAGSLPTTAPGVRHHRHHQSLLHALRALTLTAAQKQQVSAFHDQEKQANLNADPATRAANGAAMRRQIMGILTPDQKAQLAVEMQHGKAGNAMPTPNPAATP